MIADEMFRKPCLYLLIGRQCCRFFSSLISHKYLFKYPPAAVLKTQKSTFKELKQDDVTPCKFSAIYLEFDAYYADLWSEQQITPSKVYSMLSNMNQL